jgi:hypothetical protein
MRVAFEEFSRSDVVDQIPPEIDKNREINPDLMSMEQYLKFEDWDSRKL